jgi:heme-degrading monooxygenase HmoA
MDAVICEVRPRPGTTEDDLRMAGFLAIERFAGCDDRSRVLSLSIWRDEKAVMRRRTQSAHYAAREAAAGSR